jgi:hypothetical protein
MNESLMFKSDKSVHTYKVKSLLSTSIWVRSHRGHDLDGKHGSHNFGRLY